MNAYAGSVILVAAAVALVLSASTARANDVTETLLKEYQLSGVKAFSAKAGEAMWKQDMNGRSCTNCHSPSVKTKGRHQSTKKLIEPMAPSINPLRLTDRKKINKWFLRNCKWTFGRECSPQEKGDFLFWLRTQ